MQSLLQSVNILFDLRFLATLDIGKKKKHLKWVVQRENNPKYFITLKTYYSVSNTYLAYNKNR